MKQTLTRTERNRRAMNGLPMDAPRPLIRKSSERNPMIDLEAADEEAELERARKAQPTHQAAVPGAGTSASESEAGEAQKGVIAVNQAPSDFKPKTLLGLPSR